MDVNSAENHTLTKKVLWKLDCHILPPLALLWLANFIDRSNVGNAGIAGLETDLHLTGHQFNTALAVFFVSYLAIELPSNWVLKKMQANRWIPLLVFCWGVVTTLSGLIQSFGGLVAVRFILGMCEGGLLPGIVLYLSTIYKRHELQFRIGIFYASSSLSGAFGGLLATAIIKMEGVGGLAGWRWIFILEGIATILSSIIAALVLPAGIMSAKFLTEEERAFALRRFRAADTVSTSAPLSEGAESITAPASDTEKEGENTEIREHAHIVKAPSIYQEDEEFEWREVVRGLTDLQTWLTGFAYFGLLVSLYSFSLFLPTIISGLGFKGPSAQLHTVPPYVAAVFFTIVVAYYSDRFKVRGPFILLFLPITIAGYVLAIAATTNTARYAAVFLIAAGLYPSIPAVLSILPNNSSGHYKKATTTALQLAIANSGGLVATFAYTPDQIPRYIRGHSIVLAFVCMSWVLIAANVVYCASENKARRNGHRQANLVRYQELWDSGKTRAPIGDRHPDFRFTL